ncbi:DUF3794 and LysM peptidoglycan-binding domain-containing protein [Ethanoligenens harbinense]|uniref:Peptidoglycan-binding lysin domain n=1 Tax=Ethanoligenens harbinense (strain DSM 18485 / JCM 12961 / CGMCC 1.5033 / YUAN-3) TaxID=663278 RepID=E6U9B1_ETHHY|nr:SPOCS domain-containing protein [Ethanoligenens harbinense]ADU27270.1 Peptidoglycan-binding lysin domain [Ethanoligenens harbinense YUAN-3]AVQ96335.1 DUF3794 domain-containing protein [Ethanoligenens harbinense YUAN-3]AYF38993.1 DUF3794 domain-containing protein [Ethanoligenens harbinense]AYF41746.1 DUF3794 domain-containing protein [Ethanoligenens harbinense]QCN92576.1 DUF3794 domain-containing protein [Ethanoligenens harbinense]
MDLPITRDTVRVSAPVLDTAADHPVDCDIILPDYCPDVSRVLKTEGCVEIDAKQVDGARLTVSGTFYVRVLYITENSGNVRCLKHETAFTHTFDLGEEGVEARARVRARVAYVNCRLIGPRRVQVRGSLAIRAIVMVEREEEFISGVEDTRLETCARPVRCSTHVGSAEKPFDVHEQLEISYGKPPVASVIQTDAVAVVQDYKLISNKVIAKGEIRLKTLYSAETEDGEGGVEVMEHAIPVSQIIDLPGVDEDCGCTLRLIPGVVNSTAQPDGEGENRKLDVQMTVTAEVSAYRTREVTALIDAFSPEYEVALQTRPVTLLHVADTVHTTEMVRQTVELEAVELKSVTDCTVQANLTESKFEGGALLLTGELQVSVFAVDVQGGPVCADKTVPFSIREELKNASGSMRGDPDVQVVSNSYTLSGPNRLDLRVECAVDATVFTAVQENAVADLDMDDSQPKELPPQKTLTLYFADKGESVWEIAKRYNTSPEGIKQENNLEEDALDARSMLLIPKQRRHKS